MENKLFILFAIGFVGGWLLPIIIRELYDFIIDIYLTFKK